MIVSFLLVALKKNTCMILNQTECIFYDSKVIHSELGDLDDFVASLG